MGIVAFHKRTLSAICLYLFFICLFSTVTSAQEIPPPKSTFVKSAAKLMKAVSKPKNPKQLLQNMKFAIKNDLLIRDDFYTDENLKKLFGGNRVKWLDNKQNNKHAEILNFAGLFENAEKYKGGGMHIYWEKLDSNKAISDTGKVHVRVSINTFGDSRFRAEVVENVFGTKMQVKNLYKDNDPSPLSPGNHRLGNKVISYTFSNPTLKSSIGFVVRGDGSIDRCNINQNVM
ncbi:MAG: hypothetical protein LWW87_12355 [Geobacteraceae bacterium]|nr:hypothetical protein [Geobacteraceae bacterium]